MSVTPQLRPTGQMTRAMRAVGPRAFTAAERALRVGVVREGRVVEERLFRERVRITIGGSERATFVVPMGDVREHLLFAGTGDGWTLRLPRGATGRVALAHGMVDAATLGGEISLDRDARGKLVVGATTFLFQLVDPPPPKAVPQLPLAVRTGNDVDWTLTVIAAFSFLLHFGLVGAMYSDWLDEPVPEVSVAGLVDLTRTLPPSAPTVDVVDTATAPTTSASAPANASKAPANATSSQHGTSTSSSTSDAHAALVAAEARSMGMELIGAMGGSSAVENALNRSELPLTDLTGVAQSEAGVSPTGEVTVADNHAPLGQRRSLQDLGNGRIDPTTPVGTRTVAGPKVDGVVDPGPVVGTVPVPNLEAVIAKLRPSFRSCYQQKGLAIDPTMAGKLVIRIDIAPNGDVRSVTKAGGSGLSQPVEQCIVQKVQNASFDAPGGGGAKVDVPISFYNGAK